VFQEANDFRRSQLAGVALAVEEDQATRPPDAALRWLGPTEMGEGGGPDLIEEARRRWSRIGRRRR
jgi:hypothetical protein